MRMGCPLEPEAAARCVSIIGDGTECQRHGRHRNTVFRQVPASDCARQQMDRHDRRTAFAVLSCNLAGRSMPSGLRPSEPGRTSSPPTPTTRRKSKPVWKRGSNWRARPFTILIIREPASAKSRPRPTGRSSPWTRNFAASADVATSRNRGLEDGTRPAGTTSVPAACPACRLQMCPFKALSVAGSTRKQLETALPHAPEVIDVPVNFLRRSSACPSPSAAWAGRKPVLRQGAGASGLPRRVRRPQHPQGETHGMAQMGGPVISTFGCGECSARARAGDSQRPHRHGKAEALRPASSICWAAGPRSWPIPASCRTA